MATETAQVEIAEPPSPPVAGSAADSPAAKSAGGAQAIAAEPPAKGRGSKGKGSKPSQDVAASAEGPSVAAHPRAARSVAVAKGWGGLGGFLIAGYLSLPTSTLAEAGLRALVAGSVCYVAAWGGAVFVWRRLVMIEIKGREEQLLEAAQSARARHDPPAAGLERSSARAAS